MFNFSWRVTLDVSCLLTEFCFSGACPDFNSTATEQLELKASWQESGICDANPALASLHRAFQISLGL